MGKKFVEQSVIDNNSSHYMHNTTYNWIPKIRTTVGEEHPAFVVRDRLTDVTNIGMTSKMNSPRTLRINQLNSGKMLPLRGGGGSLPHGPEAALCAGFKQGNGSPINVQDRYFKVHRGSKSPQASSPNKPAFGRKKLSM